MSKSNSPIILRDYQERSLSELYKWFENNRGNPVAELPTGAGKSIIIGEFIKRACEGWPETRILCLTHVKELIQQNEKAMKAVWPEIPLGVYSAGLNRREVMWPITIAGIQSIHKRSGQFGWIDLVLIDECHLLSPNSETMYQKFLNELRAVNKNMKVVGFTATPFRTKEGLILDGDLFDEIATKVTVTELIEKGYLSSLISKSGVSHGDMSKLRVRGGEYTKDSMAAAMDKEEITEAALDEVFKFAEDRKKWLFFCSGVDHAENVAKALRERGVSCECLHGGTPKVARQQMINDFKLGKIKALTNCDVLTTGFDDPEIDCLILLRPTQSTGLYIQILGRGMRIAPEKENCLVLDFAGNIERFGPIDQIEVRQKKKKGEQDISVAPVKICPNEECRAPNPVMVRVCKECGAEFPIDENPSHGTEASSGAILSAYQEPERWEVDDVRYSEFVSKKGNTTMLVQYDCGFSVFKEWVCFDHEGFARKKAERWWSQRTRRHVMSEGYMPSSVKEAVQRAKEGELRMPSSILIKKDKKYKRIVKHEWSEGAGGAEQHNCAAR